MANNFYQAPQVARLGVALVEAEPGLLGTISRNLEDDLLGGGGKGRTVDLKVPTALVARTREIDDKTTSIVLDELSETTVSVTLGTHAYNAVSLSEGDLTLNLRDFGSQVLAPQVDSVVDFVNTTILRAVKGIPALTGAEAAAIRPFDPARPAQVFTDLRKVLRLRGVPVAGLQTLVGPEVYAALLDSDQMIDAGSSVRGDNVGVIRGFNVVESLDLEDDEIAAYHRDAFTAAIRPPVTSPGAKFGATVRGGGFALRYLRDYLVDKTVDRSMVSTFVGVATMPLFKIERNYGAGGHNATDVSAVVSQVPGGAALRWSISAA